MTNADRDASRDARVSAQVSRLAELSRRAWANFTTSDAKHDSRAKDEIPEVALRAAAFIQAEQLKSRRKVVGNRDL